MLRKSQASQCPYVFSQLPLAGWTAQRSRWPDRGLKEEAKQAWKQRSVLKVEWLCGNGRNQTQHWPNFLPFFAEEQIRADQHWREWVEINEASIYGKTSDAIVSLGGQPLSNSQASTSDYGWVKTTANPNCQHILYFTIQQCLLGLWHHKKLLKGWDLCSSGDILILLSCLSIFIQAVHHTVPCYWTQHFFLERCWQFHIPKWV